MKKKLYIMGVLLCFIVSCFFLPTKEVKAATFDKRAVWISYLDIGTLKDKSESTFRANFTTMCKTAKAREMNTLIVHVRPYADALYPSSYFHWSSYVSSKNKNPGYDPLKIMVEIAHKNQLKIEAWLNPYRISTSQTTYNTFKTYSPIKSWLNTSKTIKYGAYNYILNPASSEVQDYVVKGVAEIVSKYAVDGIHLDDYFYVSGTFGSTSQTQRKQYVNQLVKKIYSKVKEINKTVTFGISPQGNIKNCRSAGADVDTWLTYSGYVDYLMPQIYWTDQWGTNGKTTMFSDRLKQWTSLHKNKSVKMYAGLALYNAVSKPSGDIGWSLRNDNLLRQIQKLDAAGWNGFSVFQYLNLLDKRAEAEIENFLGTSVSLNATSSTLHIGSTYQLCAKTISSTLTWTSSNTKVATVSSTGKVTAKAEGSAVITLKTPANKMARCTITVSSPTISLSRSSFTTYTGVSTQLRATVSNGVKATWKSSNTDIATVSSSGVITAKKAGTVTIGASATGCSTKSISVTVRDTTIRLQPKSTTAYTGIGYQLKATVYPSNASVKWYSSNTRIATVNSNGLVMGKKPGRVTITAKVNGKQASRTVTVRSSSLKVNASYVAFNRVRSYCVKASASPSARISWSSSNPKVASVSSSGKIYAKKRGTAYIYVRANGITKKVYVRVYS